MSLIFKNAKGQLPCMDFVFLLDLVHNSIYSTCLGFLRNFSNLNAALGMTEDRPDEEFVVGEGQQYLTEETPSHELSEEVSLLEETIAARVLGM